MKLSMLLGPAELLKFMLHVCMINIQSRESWFDDSLKYTFNIGFHVNIYGLDSFGHGKQELCDKVAWAGVALTWKNCVFY